MKRGFRIWLQNSNQVTFDPIFWPKKSVENSDILPKSGNFSILDSSWAKKEVKCYSIRILRPDSESSRHSVYLRSHLILFEGFDFLTFQCISKIFKSHVPHVFCKLRIFVRIFGVRIVLCKGISLGKFKFRKKLS